MKKKKSLLEPTVVSILEESYPDKLFIALITTFAVWEVELSSKSIIRLFLFS